MEIFISTRRYNVELRRAELLKRVEQNIPPSVSAVLKEDLGGGTD